MLLKEMSKIDYYNYLVHLKYFEPKGFRMFGVQILKSNIFFKQFMTRIFSSKGSLVRGMYFQVYR